MVIVLGSAISLVYYLRVIAAVWIRPDAESTPAAARTTPGGQPIMAGAAPEEVETAGGGRAVVSFDDEDERPVVRDSRPWAIAVAVVCAAATVVFGIYPGPLFDVAQDTSEAFVNLL